MDGKAIPRKKRLWTVAFVVAWLVGADFLMSGVDRCWPLVVATLTGWGAPYAAAVAVPGVVVSLSLVAYTSLGMWAYRFGPSRAHA